MSRWILFFLVTVGLVSAVQLSAQKSERFVFGQMDAQQFNRAVPREFSQSPAVVLADFGQLYILGYDNGPVARVQVHSRIKVMADQGGESYLLRIPIHENSTGSVRSIKANTIKVNPEGEIVVFKVPEERIREVKNKRGEWGFEIEFPFVEAGSVVEYQFEMQYRDLFNLPTWHFQRDMPIISSTFHSYLPNELSYLRLVEGYATDIVFDTETKQGSPKSNLQLRSTRNATTQQVPFTGSNMVVHDVYKMRMLPAVERESFAPTAEEFIPRLTIQIKEDRFYLRDDPDLFDDWESLNKRMWKKSDFGRWLTKSKVLKQRGQAVALRLGSSKEKAEAIYTYVRTNMRWNGEYGIFSDNLEKAFEDREGNSGEINLILTALLRGAGLHAYPVLISTRDNGRIQTLVPRVDQFNHVIVAVKDLESDIVLIDALLEGGSFGMLPSYDLNGLGLRVDPSDPAWLALRSKNQLVRHTYSRFELTSEGKLKGAMTFSSEDYSAYLERKRLRRYEGQTESYLRENLLVGMDDAQILDFSVSNEGASDGAMIVSCRLVTPDYVEKAGGLIFVHLMLSQNLEENPFKADKRSYPVEFTYPLRDRYLIGLRIPPGYEVAQLPAAIRVIIPDGAATFTYDVFELENILYLNSSLRIDKTTFQPEEYQGIREFFQYVVQKHAEAIVLQPIAN